jgi:hypothetical protein
LLEDIEENELGKCAVQFNHLNDSAKFIITLMAVTDRIEFMNSIYGHKEIKQVSGGMSLEQLNKSIILKTTI